MMFTKRAQGFFKNPDAKLRQQVITSLSIITYQVGISLFIQRNAHLLSHIKSFHSFIQVSSSSIYTAPTTNSYTLRNAKYSIFPSLSSKNVMLWPNHGIVCLNWWSNTRGEHVLINSGSKAQFTCTPVKWLQVSKILIYGQDWSSICSKWKMKRTNVSDAFTQSFF